LTARVAIIDYGMGNLASVAKAFAALGAETSFATTPEQVEAAPVLVLPGVGAFPDAMANLARAGLDRAIVAAARAGRPLLGICLGMQLLFARGTEKGDCAGLGLLDGTVVRFPDDGALKVPHMGWNQLEPAGAHPLFRDVAAGAFVYFVHSYFPRAADGDVLATSEYGVRFPCVVGRGRTVGIQFHPEKSQKVGLKLLSNFLEMSI
jgi:glutamine amidotransferase